MVKEYKIYDRIYKRFAGTAIKEIERIGGRIAREDLHSITGWGAALLPWNFREDYSNELVRFAVYEASTAEGWQKFRVSMKGLSTNEKLYALAWWSIHHEEDSYTVIRINNYLGALKRGGQLDSDLNIIPFRNK